MGGRGASSSSGGLGKTYTNAPIGVKKEVNRIIDTLLKPDDNDMNYFEATGHFESFINTTLNGNRYKISAEIKAKNKGELYNEKNLKYLVKQGNKILIKNGSENNIKNFLAVQLNKQMNKAKK